MKLVLAVLCLFFAGVFCQLPRSIISTRALPPAAPNPNDLNIYFENEADCDYVFDNWAPLSGSCTYTNRCADYFVITQEESDYCEIYAYGDALKVQYAQIKRVVGIDSIITTNTQLGQICTAYQITTDTFVHAFCSKNYNCMACTTDGITAIGLGN